MKHSRKKAPRLLHKLLQNFISGSIRNEAMEDFDENFRDAYEKRGYLFAVCWYLFQIVLVIPDFISSSISRNATMLKNYFKIALRQLYKNKSHSLINILGLSLSLSVFLLIVLFVQHEFSYDTFHQDYKNIYRIHQDTQTPTGINKESAIPLPVGVLLKNDYPEVINSVRFTRMTDVIVRSGNTSFKEENFVFADPSVFDVLDFELLDGGESSVLREPNAITITEETAGRYFGDEDPIGKVLTLEYSHSATALTFNVKAVVANLPDNSHILFDFLAPMDEFGKFFNIDVNASGSGGMWSTVMAGFSTYVQLNDNASIETFESKLPDFVSKHYPDNMKGNVSLSTILMSDIHLRSDRSEMFKPVTSAATIYILLTIAFFILVIACINFMNLTTAKSVARGKEVGMRKVMGAHRKQLVKQYLLESNVVSFVSVILGVVLAQLLLPYFNALVEKSLSLNLLQNTTLLLILAGTGVFVGILSGSYPAFLLSAFIPVKALKSTLSKREGNINFRRVLVVMQFSISVLLLVSTFLIYNQLDYIFNKNLGFDRENLVYLEVPMTSTPNQYLGYRNELLAKNEITGATTTFKTMGVSVSGRPLRPEGIEGNGDVSASYIYTDRDFARVFGLEYIVGEEAVNNEQSSTSFIVNEAAVKAWGWDEPLGKRIDRVRNGQVQTLGTVAAVVKDFHFVSLHNEIQPIVIALFPNLQSGMGNLAVKIAPENTSETIDFMKSKWNEFYPGRPFTFSFLDDNIDRLYNAESKLMDVLVYLTVIAIFVACLGLFGLASFMAEQRTKEIGIRKTLGATVSNLLVLVSKEFAILVLVSNIFAWPVAYYFMNKWLESFAYRIDIGYFVFFVAAFTVFTIAIITVGYQALKAASIDPVRSLRYE